MDAPSRLFACDILDAKDDWEQDLLQCYTKFNDDKAGKSEMELHAYLQEKASQKEGYTKLMSGLFYGALVEPDAIGQYFQYITIVNRDQYVSVKDRLYVLVKSIRFSALHRPVIGSILWIYNELTKMSVLSMDGLYIWLVRQIRGGVDLSPNNLYLCDQVLRLVEHHQAWFDSFPRLLASIVYLYLRLIPEHRNIQASPLQQKEIRFVITMLRQKWPVCSLVGRDLVRGLQDVYHIPDFKHFWNDMNHRPQQISPSFKGIHCLLKTPTAKEFLRVRLTPDMEHKLMFILQELRFNSFQRNLNWFIQRFMGNAEAEGFIVDIVRFIIAGWYPNNQLLQSDVVPRYVVIGSLIRTIKSAVVSSNVKLALTFDWLFFNPNDNLMLIEPVMLLIERSAEKYPHITSTMIEFIYHASNEYFLQLKEDMRRSLATGMRVMLKMQVTRSLVPLYQCSSLEPPVKQMIMELFGEFLQVPFTSELPPPADNDSTVASMPSTVEQSSAAEQPVSLNANVTPMDVDTMPKPDQLEVADVTLSAPDQEAVTKPTKQQEQILVADTAVPLDTNLLSKNGDVDMSGAIDAEPSAKVMSGSSAPQPLPTLPNISVSANCTTISSDALKAICTSEDEYSDSDVDLDGPGGKDQQLSTNRQNQSNWIFGDAIGRFKSASASFLTVWPGDQDEASVQLIIAKRSLKEILDVYMSMSVASDTLVASIGPWILKIGTQMLLPHSHTLYGKVKSVEDIVMNDAYDPLDIVLWMCWSSISNLKQTEKLIPLLSGLSLCRHGKKRLVGMRCWYFIAAHAEGNDSKVVRPWIEVILSVYSNNFSSSAPDNASNDAQTSLSRQLFRDLKFLSHYNIEAFQYASLVACQHMTVAASMRLPLLCLVVRMTLPDHLAQWILKLQSGTLELFGNDMNLHDLGSAMVTMDYFETLILWQMMDAEIQAQNSFYTGWITMDLDNLLGGAYRLDILPMLLSCLTHLPPGQELFQSLLQFSNRYIKQDASSFLLLVLRAWHRSNAQALAATLAGTVELLIKCIQKTESSAEIIGAQLTDVLVAWWVKDDSGLGVYLDNAPLMTVMTQLAALVDKTWPEDWQAKPNPPFTKRRVKKVMIPQSDEESE